MMQVADTVLMIRPAAFGYNAETAANNHFQYPGDLDAAEVQQGALQQFDSMVAVLRSEGIEVVVVEDTIEPAKPDAVFPNNWFSANNERLTVFPMFAPTRKLEKRSSIIDALKERFVVKHTEDWSHYENTKHYLEGTGSMVIDHANKTIYACLSPRTSGDLVKLYAKQIGYTAITFTACDEQGRSIYHTNVMLCIGEGFAVICLDAISGEAEREAVKQPFLKAGHSLIVITQAQMAAFAGNMLQLKNGTGDRFITLSQTAHRSLEPAQVAQLEKHGKLLPINVSFIEQEGGSVRCMMAEILLTRNDDC
ncbi:MAG: amidinotransferase [Flaviaesturariibacter sp.]|nr:amidinotransferase [Flaviaesturariibacter sp.]